MANASMTARAAGGTRGEVADGELVRRVREGAREAYSQLVQRHQDALYRYARGMRLDHDTACDLVQDAFVSAYRRLDQCRDADRFRSWLFRIHRNGCLDWLKNIRRQGVPLEDVTLESDDDSPHAAARQLELRGAISAALDQLTDDLRDAFLMKHHEGRSYEEMADIAGASVSAMKMRVHRARDALREHLIAAGVSPGAAA